jgi:threo-3-hydroxy-L-aspartate ammonia-lyase
VTAVALSIGDIKAAAAALHGVAHRTPVIRSAALDEISGNRLFMKAESFQRVGAFKFRGAYFALSRLSDADRAHGVVAYSSGNHAQGVALAAKLLGIRATIVMPRDASPIKLAATRGYGADVIAYDPATSVREEIAARVQREQGAVLIPPFDHPDVIAGQGTAGLELLESVHALDVLVAPAGGGGLLSGCAIAAKALLPQIEIFGAEPQAGNDWALSWERGEPVTIPEPHTIAEGLRLRHPGLMTWPILRSLATGFVTVSEEEIVRAMRLLFERAKIVVEPAGAVPVAAALFGRLPVAGKRVGIVISGGNVDAATFASIVS